MHIIETAHSGRPPAVPTKVQGLINRVETDEERETAAFPKQNFQGLFL